MLSFLYGPTVTPYTTTGKTIASAVWTFVGKMMSLLFNMLPRFVIASLSRKDAYKLIVRISCAPSGDVQCSFVVLDSRVIPDLPICTATAVNSGHKGRTSRYPNPASGGIGEIFPGEMASKKRPNLAIVIVHRRWVRTILYETEG